MSVETILAIKGRDVVTIEPGRTMAEAASILDRHRIGAAVVVDPDGAVLGILSERDIVKAVAQGGGEALADTVGARMTAKVVTCAATSEIDEIMSLMTSGKFRHVPVVEGGRLGGIVSIGDVVKHRLEAVEAEHKAMRDYIATA